MTAVPLAAIAQTPAAAPALPRIEVFSATFGASAARRTVFLDSGVIYRALLEPDTGALSLVADGRGLPPILVPQVTRRGATRPAIEPRASAEYVVTLTGAGATPVLVRIVKDPADSIAAACHVRHPASSCPPGSGTHISPAVWASLLLIPIFIFAIARNGPGN